MVALSFHKLPCSCTLHCCSSFSSVSRLVILLWKCRSWLLGRVYSCSCMCAAAHCNYIGCAGKNGDFCRGDLICIKLAIYPVTSILSTRSSSLCQVQFVMRTELSSSLLKYELSFSPPPPIFYMKMVLIFYLTSLLYLQSKLSELTRLHAFQQDRSSCCVHPRPWRSHLYSCPSRSGCSQKIYHPEY